MLYINQLSYSVNKVQRGVAVRLRGALEPKHALNERMFRRERLVKVKIQFLPYFFLLWRKSKNRNFSNEDHVGSKFFPALDLFVPFFGNAIKELRILITLSCI
jgi:hypothetical protein